jgi:hypothetical protein
MPWMLQTELVSSKETIEITENVIFILFGFIHSSCWIDCSFRTVWLDRSVYMLNYNGLESFDSQDGI